MTNIGIHLAVLMTCLLTSTSACKCQGIPNCVSQSSFCYSEFAIEVVATGSTKIPGDGYKSQWPHKHYTRFTVNTTKVYKRSPAYDAIERKDFVFTYYHNSCSDYLEEGERYLIRGNLTRGRIFLSLCGLRPTNMLDLSMDQQRWLERGYLQSCDRCQIEYCSDPVTCDQHVRSNRSCLQNNGNSSESCYRKHAICQASRPDAACEWVGGGSGLFRSCLTGQIEAPTPQPGQVEACIAILTETNGQPITKQVFTEYIECRRSIFVNETGTHG